MIRLEQAIENVVNTLNADKMFFTESGLAFSHGLQSGRLSSLILFPDYDIAAIESAQKKVDEYYKNAKLVGHVEVAA